MNFGKYSKVIVAASALAVAVLTRLLGADDPIVQEAIGLLGVLGVYGVKNA